MTPTSAGSVSKLDLLKQLGDLYRAPADKVVVVEVPEMNFLMIDGQGDPNSAPLYQGAVEALYAASYGIKFSVKKGPSAIDYKVMPLEGLWWADDPQVFLDGRREEWRWTMMIAQPDFVTAELVAEVVAATARKKDLPLLQRMRFEAFVEGRCAQIMHIGPYTEEGPTIEKLHAFVAEKGCALREKHHEIYLGDPRRTAPERLKTIIRQPVLGDLI